LVDRVAYRTYWRCANDIESYVSSGRDGFQLDRNRYERPYAAAALHFSILWMLHAASAGFFLRLGRRLSLYDFWAGIGGLSFALFVYETVRAIVRGVPLTVTEPSSSDAYALRLLFLFLWMVAEYVGMIFEEVRHRRISSSRRLAA